MVRTENKFMIKCNIHTIGILGFSEETEGAERNLFEEIQKGMDVRTAFSWLMFY